MNVCTLLSNEGKHTLKLAKCPRLLDLLLSHAGVYQHRKFYKFLGRAGRGNSFVWPGGLRSNPSGKNLRRSRGVVLDGPKSFNDLFYYFCVIGPLPFSNAF